MVTYNVTWLKTPTAKQNEQTVENEIWSDETSPPPSPPPPPLPPTTTTKQQ